MKKNENHITIKLTGFSCSAEEITKKLGLQPTKVALKGQEYQIGPKHNRVTKKYSDNYWEFREVRNASAWISDLVSEYVKHHIIPRKKDIKEIVSNCDGEFSIVQYVNEGSNPGLHFKKEEITLFANIGLELDIDIYCLAND